MTAPIVGHGEHEEAGAMAGVEANRSGRRLAGGQAHVRRFDAVVDAVAGWRDSAAASESIEDLAIDFGRAARDFDLRLLAELTGEIREPAAGKPSTPSPNCAHPGRDDLAIETLQSPDERSENSSSSI